MSTEYDLKERIKELENEIKNLLEEQNHYLRIILNKRRQSLSIDNELQEVPTYLSNYIHKRIHSLSNEDKDSSRELEKKIQQAIDYLCNSCR